MSALDAVDHRHSSAAVGRFASASFSKVDEVGDPRDVHASAERVAAGLMRDVDSEQLVEIDWEG